MPDQGNSKLDDLRVIDTNAYLLWLFPSMFILGGIFAYMARLFFGYRVGSWIPALAVGFIVAISLLMVFGWLFVEQPELDSPPVPRKKGP